MYFCGFSLRSVVLCVIIRQNGDAVSCFHCTGGEVYSVLRYVFLERSLEFKVPLRRKRNRELHLLLCKRTLHSDLADKSDLISPSPCQSSSSASRSIPRLPFCHSIILHPPSFRRIITWPAQFRFLLLLEGKISSPLVSQEEWRI